MQNVYDIWHRRDETWISLNDLEVDDHFVWGDGEPME